MAKAPTPYSHPNAVIAVLGKAPVAGKVKTRMQPQLSPQQSAHLQARLVDHTLNTCLNSHIAPVQLWCAPDIQHACFQAHAQHVELKEQIQGDLGKRMQYVFDYNQHAEFVLLVGTDCPLLSAQSFINAAHAATQTDVVIKPAHDGGYVLIGGRTIPNCFNNINWGTEKVFQQTTQALDKSKQTYTELSILSDLDFFEDLNALPSELKTALLKPHHTVDEAEN